MEEIKIPLSNRKTILSIIGCLVFILASIWLMIEPERFLNFRRQSEVTIVIIGIIGLVIFSILLIFIFIKFFQRKSGLTLNEDGFIDNSGGTSAGFVKWEDVISIGKTEVFNQKFVLVLVKTPELYINRQKSMVKRKLIASNNSHYGSPIQISANFLEIKFDELHDLMKAQFKIFKSNNS